jgi:pantoate--beta-alanine ligase
MSLPDLLPNIPAIRAAVRAAREADRRVGFVPTMGALHAGHAKLIETARAESDFVVVSIFVNPTQFGPSEDFNKYPRTLDADRELCAKAGADVIFAPMASEMYPAGFRTLVEVPELQDQLCGASRPGHFRGVCTVVAKLFNIVQPDIAFFGQKDAQQVLIIRRMVIDLNMPIEIRTVPTVREADGLALSSRNRYLSPEDRRQAPALYQSLRQAQELVDAGERDPTVIESAVAAKLAQIPNLKIDYVRAVNAETLEKPPMLRGPTLIALAAFLGGTRLIDNIQLDIPATVPR